MKHKGLILTILGIVSATVFSLMITPSEDRKNEVVTVGILQFVTHDALDEINRGIVDGLSMAGYSGEKIKLVQMNAESNQSNIQSMSKQLVVQSDLVIGIATPAAQGLASATTKIPVVMSGISDPVGANLVSDLEKPSANVTGTSNQLPLEQSVDLIRQLTSRVKKVGVLYSSAEDNSLSQVNKFKELAKKFGINVVEYAVPSANDLAATMSVAVNEVDAFFVPQDNTIASAFPIVVNASQKANIPVYSSVDSMVEQGSLAAIAQSQYDIGVETAEIVSQILAGQKVQNIPVKVINTGQPVINQDVVDDLGISVPKDLLEEAKVIEKGD